MQRVLSIGWVLSDQIRAFWAGLETILALMFPSFRQKLTLSSVRRLGGFDRRYYQAQLPENQRLFRLFALRHYAVFGEVAGLAPSAQFNPNTYLRINPDVEAAGVPPLWHWLTRGQNECRRVDDARNAPRLPNELPKAPKLNARSKQAELAAHIHVHYEDVWREIAGLLGQISLEIDLIVTLSYRGPETLHLRDQIQRAHPNADVHIFENRGRDILPFVTLINHGAFDGYRAVCKLHTKRSLHRVDGDRWRRRLLEGILRRDTSKLLRRFLDDPDLAVWVSDGQLLQGSKWWGGNKGKVNALLRRIELRPNSNHPYFPSGSMYWIKPFTIGMIRSLDLKTDDFEEESGQLDGTTAHAIERVVGELVLASGQKVIETSQLKHHTARGIGTKPCFVSAFYLPQFHRVEENDAWWGEGYTEWTGVRSARPSFLDHLLAKPAQELGEYDLFNPDVMGQQAKLAVSAGIDAFCVYHYWFGERRLLEAPIDRLLADRSVAFPFYLCWANESWRRNWDGLSGEVLMQQSYPAGFEETLAWQTSIYMRDPRYQKPDGVRPRFVIYRPENLPDPKKTTQRLRSAWQRAGVGEVEIGGVLFHGEKKCDADLVDFWIEMPPHGLFDPSDVLNGAKAPAGLSCEFSGFVYDYARLASRSVSHDYAKSLPKNCIRGVMPSWDNSARRGNQAHIAYGATPAGFRKWLLSLARDGLERSYGNELMINAWNEWGEKLCLSLAHGSGI